MQWRDGNSSPGIALMGLPGAGKSVQTSIVIDHLATRAQQDDSLVAFVYLDRETGDIMDGEVFVENINF